MTHKLLISGLAIAVTALITAISPVMAQSGANDAVRDARGNFVRDARGECVRTKWGVGSDPCAPQARSYATFKEVGAGSGRVFVMDRKDRTVYFDFDKAELRDDAKETLDKLVKRIKDSGEVIRADIIGHTDIIGSDSYNDRLSKRRALAVQDYLASKQFMNTSVVVNTRGVGKEGKLTDCTGKKAKTELIDCLQIDRRVEVMLHYVQ